MHEFRRKIGQQPARAVDGFLRPSARPGQLPGSDVPHGVPVARRRGLGVTPRRLDDFSRKEGLHTTTRPTMPLQAVPDSQKPLKVGPVPAASAHSLLHMTLPGGTLDTETKKQHKLKMKGKLTRGQTIRKWSLRSGIVVVLLVLLGGGFLFTKGFFKIHKVFKGGGSAAALQANVAPDLLKGEGSGRVNILLFGKGGGNHEGPDLTDTLLVLSVDPVNKTATMVSIPRDLWVTPQGFGAMKINAVYANEKYHDLSVDPKNTAKAERDGVNLAEQEVTDVLGIPINYYGMVDFQAFQQAVDTLGGVDLTVTTDTAVTDYMYNEDTHKPYTLSVQPGVQHFDGLRALMYARSRHASARGDFDRTERQRLLIEAMSEKALSAGTYTNPIKLSQLMSTFGDNVSTDFGIKDVLRLMTIVKGVGTSNIKSIGLADPPNNYVVTDNINGVSIVRPTAGIGDYDAIQNYIRNTLKDPYIAKENAALEVLNGTGMPGLATAKSNDLKSYGYNVTKVDDAPTSDYQKTILVDLSGGKKPYTKNYLQERYNVKAVTKLPDSTIQAQGADFVVILGQDATTSSQD